MRDWDTIYKVKDSFLDAVREAFREARKQIQDDEDWYAFKFAAQDELSMFSPWMSAREPK